MLSSLASEIEDGLKKVIDQSQYIRLQQIARQVRGPATFSDPDVEDALDLSSEQKEKIRAIQSKLPGFLMGDLPPGGPGGNRPPPGDDHGPPPDFAARNDRGTGSEPSPKPDQASTSGNAGRNDARRREDPAKIKQEAVKEILALLSDEQREAWNTLTGEPFTGQVFQRTGGRRGGRGGFGFGG